MVVNDVSPAQRAALDKPVELIVFGLIFAQALYVVASILQGSYLGGAPNDFVDVWAAGQLVLHGTPAAAYDWPTHKAMEVFALGHPFNGYFGWHYPPTYLSVAALLARLPYTGAEIFFLFSTFLAYLFCQQRILRGRFDFLLAAAFPAVLANIMAGQNGFLSAALLGGTLLTLNTRPILSGVLLGLLTYKPHLGLLFPIVLAASGHWRTFITAAAVAALTALASWMAFGGDTWAAFFASIAHTSRAFLGEGWADFGKLQTAFGLVRTLGGSEPLAWVVQSALGLTVVAAVVIVWRSEVVYELKAAALATGALLATPYLYTYDLVVLAVPLAFIWRLGRERGYLTHELAGISVASLLVLIFPFVKAPVGFAAVMVVAALIARRFRQTVLPITTRAKLSRTFQFGTGTFVVLIWAVATLCLWISFGSNSLSTDDAMRLVEVRDLLGGQNWFDLTQYRLDPPLGVVTHWSRLVDLPLAFLIEAAKTLLPGPLAEHAVMMIWPAALLLALFAGVARIAGDLAGPLAARVSVLFAAMMAPALQHFRLGSIHHHNVQLVLLIWSIAFVLRMARHPRNGAIAGLLCALSVAIGQEMVPAIAALSTVVALRWIFIGRPGGPPTIAFAASLAAGAIVLAAATIPPASYFAVHCDAISIAQVGALAIGGFGLAILAALPGLKSVAGRLAAALVLAVAFAGFIKFASPECIGDPYARLDPRLADLWLSSVAEAQGISWLLRDMPQQFLAYFGVPVAAFALGLVCCFREGADRRWNWIVLVAVQAVFILLSIWELRGTGGANAIAAVLFPAALLRRFPLAQGQPAYFGMRRAAVLIMLVINPATLLALGTGTARAVAASSVPTTRIIASGQAGTCQCAADYTPLASLPRGRMLAFIDSGPFILMQSPHAVLAAPYHRNQTGNLAMLDMFLAVPAEAKIKMAAHGIDYVAFCPGAPERYRYAQRAPHGLAAMLAANEPPDFLRRIPLPGTDLAVYRVLR